MSSSWKPHPWPPDIGSVRYGYITGGPAFVPWSNLADELSEYRSDRLSPKAKNESRSGWRRRIEHDGASFHWLFGHWPDLEFDRLLYHYTSMPRLLDIAHSQALRMGPIQTMNDPREASLGRQVLLTCFGSDAPDRPRAQVQVKDRQVGLGYLRPRMWDQYADHHRGGCLIWDKRKLDASFKRSVDHYVSQGFRALHGNVRYYLDDLELDSPSRDWGAALFLKDPDWKSEYEYRWALVPGDLQSPSDYPDELFVNLAGCLVGIVLGYRWPDSWMPVASHVAHAFGTTANVARAVAIDGNLGIELVDVS